MIAEDLFKSITKTTKDNFYVSLMLKSRMRNTIRISNGLSIFEDLLDTANFKDVNDYVTVNFLLFPRAHLYKN